MVGELRDGGHYNVDEGVSETTLVDLFKLFPMACHLHFYLDRVVAVAQRRHALGARRLTNTAGARLPRSDGFAVKNCSAGRMLKNHAVGGIFQGAYG